jgi:hypothetical protein
MPQRRPTAYLADRSERCATRQVAPSRTIQPPLREVSAGVEEFLPNDRWPSATIRAFEKRAPS